MRTLIRKLGFYVAAHKYYCCCPHVNRQHLSTCLGMLKNVVDLHVGNNSLDQPAHSCILIRALFVLASGENDEV